jgi:hypothetical protein
MTPTSSSPSLIQRAAELIERFVFLKDTTLYTLIATWVVGTHLYEQFDFYGYLLVKSPTHQCGKTRLLDILRLLVYDPSELISSPTEAVMFHSAHRHTQMFDEIDTWHADNNFQSILNAGFQHNGCVQRMWKGENGNYDTPSLTTLTTQSDIGGLQVHESVSSVRATIWGTR